MENNIKNFKNIFAEDIVSQAFSHARVNLIGEHTDYTSGYVLPTLLPYKTSVYISENRNATYAVYSEFFKEKIEFNDFIKSKTNEWVDYVKGCLFIFFDQNIKIKNTYINIYLESDIPMERGISSSSALCVATLKALNKFFGTSFSDKHIAVLAQKVERNYIGVSGGIMDQMVSSIGIHSKAFFLDCLSLNYELLEIPLNWQFCLIDSEVQRNLRDSSYNERYAQLKNAEKILGVEYLGSVKLSNFNNNDFSDEVIYKRAKHVVTENDRVLNAKRYIQNNNLSQFGELMNLSHYSYSNDFEASTKDVDVITKRSIESGAAGSRLTGGGFGGFTVSLIEKSNYDLWYKNMRKHYSEDKFFAM